MRINLPWDRKCLWFKGITISFERRIGSEWQVRLTMLTHPIKLLRNLNLLKIYHEITNFLEIFQEKLIQNIVKSSCTIFGLFWKHHEIANYLEIFQEKSIHYLEIFQEKSIHKIVNFFKLNCFFRYFDNFTLCDKSEYLCTGLIRMRKSEIAFAWTPLPLPSRW